MESSQAFFNLVVAVAGFLGVFVFNSITKKLQQLEDKLNEIPRGYVAKDDYRADMNEVKTMLHQIYEKLDSKLDKGLVLRGPNHGA